MDTKQALAAGAIAALVVVGIALTETQLIDKATTDEKTLTATDAAKTRAVRLSDAGVAYVVAQPDGGVLKLAKAPCAWKPTKTARCYRVTADGGTADPGVANTMQPGTFTGPECKRKSCVIFAGQPDDDDALPVPAPVKLEAAPKEAAPVEEAMVGP